MSRWLSNRWVLLVLRMTIGVIFVYAGISKNQNPQAFADSIATFELLPPTLINLLALGLPMFEVLLGLLLITGWQKRTVTLGILLLTTLFAIALAQGLARGLQIDCGCFGSGAASVGKTWASLGRDLVLVLVAAWMYRQFTHDSKSRP